MNVVVVSDDTVLVNDVLYRRVKTVGGKYPLDYRRSYLRAWRAKRKDMN